MVIHHDPWLKALIRSRVVSEERWIEEATELPINYEPNHAY